MRKRVQFICICLLVFLLPVLSITIATHHKKKDIAKAIVRSTPEPTTTTTAPPPPPTTTTTAAPAVRSATRQYTHTQPQRASRGGCRSLAQIAQDESGGSYTAQNSHSTASGKYQVLDSTWGGYGGYSRAKDAPPAVQEQQAAEMHARYGNAPWAASGC